MGPGVLLAVLALGGVLFLGSQDAMAGDASPDSPEDDVITGFTRFDSLFQKWGAAYNVPWLWLKACCWVESNLGRYPTVARGLAAPSDEQGSRSQDGLSWGIMQVTKTTAAALMKRPVSAMELNNPDFSVQLAAMLFQENINRFGVDDPESVFRAYNGGPKLPSSTLVYWAKIQVKLNQLGG